MSKVNGMIERMTNTFGGFFGRASVTQVYGEPRHENGATIIPAAEVFAAGGYGLGAGEEADETGGGGGVGGVTQARPVAVIIVSPEGKVRVEPVVDPTKIVLALFTTIGFAFSMRRRMQMGGTQRPLD